MALPIPQRYIPAMNKIRNLSDSAVQELVQGLDSSSITSEAKKLYEHIAPQVPSVPIDDLKAIVDLIYSLYQVREFSNLKKSSFLNELIEGVRECAEPKVSENEVPSLRDRFQRLLSIETLNIISKAINLQRDGERLYCEAAILSDVRPVFGEDVESKPVAAVITHTLKLTYHEIGGKHREFLVTLDEEDLHKLKSVIERARLKAETLDKLLKDSGIPRLGI